MSGVAEIILPKSTLAGANIKQKAIDEYTLFAEGLQAIQAGLDFKMGARDWCYYLEEHGVAKSDFDKAEVRIGIARKNGYLPLDFTLEDASRKPTGDFGLVCDGGVEDQLESLWNTVEYCINYYNPVRWVDYQRYYVELLVEKIGLTSLFAKQAAEYRIAVSNGRGDTDINSVAGMHRRFQEAQERGQKPILLYCGDHDPKGLLISDILPNRFSAGVGRYFADGTVLKELDLEVVRFGLNYSDIDT